VSSHRPSLPATSLLKPTAIPAAHAPSFSLQHIPYDVWCSQYSCPLYRIYWMFPCIVFLFWPSVALPFIGQTAVVSARKLTSAELNWSCFILIILFTGLSISLYSYVTYSTVYSPSVFFFHKCNWTEQHILCTKQKDIFTNFPFTVIILLVLFFLMCDLLLPVVCVFQFVACICYSLCPCAVVWAHRNSK